jgi:hypothetical protein
MRGRPRNEMYIHVGLTDEGRHVEYYCRYHPDMKATLKVEP